MADEFQVGVCGGNMWNISRSNFFGSSPCSMVVNDIGWPNNQDSSVIMDMKSPSKSNEDSSTSTDHHIWSQNLLFNGGRTEDNNYIDIFLQEANTCLNSSTMNYWQETSFFDCPQILVDSCLINSSTSSSDLTINKSCQEPSKAPKFPINLSSNGYSSSLLSQSIDSQLPQSLSPINNLIIDDADTSSCMPSKNSLFNLSSINDKNKLNLHIVNGKINEEAYLTKESEVVPVTKRPRIEPLPTFKVRKEKFGDRVTALQQLVSPFGKTDTASVLHEAIEYIKFLHNQVKNLSSPYLDYGSRRLQLRDNQTIDDHNNNREEQKLLQDLRSRGLCLVPISSTLSVAAETSADLWPPTFNGPLSFR